MKLRCLEGSRSSSNSYILLSNEGLNSSSPDERDAADKQEEIFFYNDDGTKTSVVVERNLRASDLCQILAVKNRVPKDGAWSLIEHWEESGFERIVEDHEDVLAVHRRTQKTERKFVFRKLEHKYDFFTDPQNVFPADMVDLTDYCAPFSTCSLTIALQQLLSTSDECPSIFSQAWIESQKNVWSKAFLLLKDRKLYMSSKVQVVAKFLRQWTSREGQCYATLEEDPNRSLEGPSTSRDLINEKEFKEKVKRTVEPHLGEDEAVTSCSSTWVIKDTEGVPPRTYVWAKIAIEDFNLATKIEAVKVNDDQLPTTGKWTEMVILRVGPKAEGTTESEVPESSQAKWPWAKMKLDDIKKSPTCTEETAQGSGSSEQKEQVRREPIPGPSGLGQQGAEAVFPGSSSSEDQDTEELPPTSSDELAIEELPPSSGTDNQETEEPFQWKVLWKKKDGSESFLRLPDWLAKKKSGESSGNAASQEEGKPEPERETFVQLLAEVGDYEVYSCLNAKKHLNAPTQYGFCLRLTHQEDFASALRLACDSQRDTNCWITAMRLAKYGKQLRENYRAFKNKQVDSVSPKDYNSYSVPNESVRSRVAMDFTGSVGRIVEDPLEAKAIAVSEGIAWKRRWRGSGCTIRRTIGGTEFHLGQPWYHQSLSRQQATSLISSHGNQDGVFLVRESRSNPGCYVLTFRCSGKVIHMTIEPIVDAVRDAVCYTLDSGVTKFYDLLQLVEFYQLNAGCLPTRLTHYLERAHTPVPIAPTTSP